MSPILPVGLKRNPFKLEFLLSQDFPFREPIGWNRFLSPKSLSFVYDSFDDCLLIVEKARKKLLKEKCIIYSLSADTRKLMPEDIREMAAQNAARWWIRYLANDVAPLFTLGPVEEVLLFRLLIWAEGSIEAVEYALQTHSDSNEEKRHGDAKRNIQRFSNEYYRKRDKIINDRGFQPQISWITLRPLDHELPRLFLLDRKGDFEVHATVAHWIDLYPNLAIKLCLPRRTQCRTMPIDAIPLEWNVENLESMVNESVQRTAEGKYFIDLYDDYSLTDEFRADLDGKSLLRFLSERANGSVSVLMAYCNRILLEHHETNSRRLERLPTVIVQRDIESALTELGLLNG